MHGGFAEQLHSMDTAAEERDVVYQDILTTLIEHLR